MTVYVASTAIGANNGTNWYDAYTSMYSVSGIYNDTILVHNQHVETLSGANLDFYNTTKSNPVAIICCNSGDGSLSTGATFKSGKTNLNFNLVGYMYGINFIELFDNWGFGTKNYSTYTLDNCNFIPSGNLNGFRLGITVGGNEIFNNCVFDSSYATNIGNVVQANNVCDLTFNNCTFISKQTTTYQTNYFNASTQDNYIITFNACDLSRIKLTGSLINITAGGAHQNWIFNGCILPTGITTLHTFSSYTDDTATFAQCYEAASFSGAPLTLKEYGTRCGNINCDDTVIRTSGANDGQRSYSWKMSSNSNCGEYGEPLITPPIVRYINAGSGIVTVYFAGSAALDNDEISIDLLSPNESGYPYTTSRHKYYTTDMFPLATPSSIITDTVSDWQGSYGGTKQKFHFTIQPAVNGLVLAFINLYKANTTVYLDPMIHYSSIT